MIGRYHSLRGSPLTWPPVQKKNLADLDVRTSRVVYCVASSKQTCLPDHLLDFFCAACINLTIHRSLPRWNAVNPRSKTAPRCWPRMGDVRRKWEAYATVSSDINDTGTDRWSYAAPTCTCRLSSGQPTTPSNAHQAHHWQLNLVMQLIDRQSCGP
jgi:hypothetical protein